MSKKSAASVDERALHLATEAVVVAEDGASEVDDLAKYLKLLGKMGYDKNTDEFKHAKALMDEQIVFLKEATKILQNKANADLRLEYLGTSNKPGKGIQGLAADLRTRAAKLAGDEILNAVAKTAGANSGLRTFGSGGTPWGGK